MMSQKSSEQEFSKPQFYQCSYASKTRSQGACCQAWKKQRMLDMQLLSASKQDACVTSRWLLTNSTLPQTQGSSNVAGLGTTVNKNHSARISACSHLACINLNVLIPWWNKQHWRVSKATQEADAVRDEPFSDRFQITPQIYSGKSKRVEQNKIYNVIAKLLVFESKTPILCEEYEGNRCSHVELNGWIVKGITSFLLICMSLAQTSRAKLFTPAIMILD